MARPIGFPIGLNPMGAAANRMMDQLGFANTDPNVPSAPPPARMMMEAGKRMNNVRNTPYKVQRGDTLTSIARENGTTVQTLIALNPGIKNPDRIFADQYINVPNKDFVPEFQRQQYRNNPYLNQNVASQIPAQGFDPRMDAIEPVGAAESMLGAVKLPAAMLGGLAAMAKMAPAALPQAGRVAIGAGSNVMPYGGNMAAARAAAYRPMQEIMAERAAAQTIQNGLEGSAMSPLHMLQRMFRNVQR